MTKGSPGGSEEQRDTAAGDVGGERPRRILTVRALVLGVVLTVLMAWVVPWNDWTLRNTLIYNNFLPPAVSLVLLCFGLVINPLLGRFRLAIGEMVVIAVMLLGLGGVVSSGLNRYLPTVIGTSAEVLASNPAIQNLRVELSSEEIAELERAFESRVASDLASLDRNGDQRLQVDEFPGTDSAFALADRDRDGGVDAAEMAAHIRSRDPDAVPTWRWPVSPELHIGVPAAGPVLDSDPEYAHVVKAYINGMDKAELRRVGHRRSVTWQRLPGGEIQADQLALSGRVADQYRREGRDFLDLDQSELGRGLVGLRAGEAVALDGGTSHTVAPGEGWSSIAEAHYGRPELARVLARENAGNPAQAPAVGSSVALPDLAMVHAVQPPGLPWYAWWGRLAVWTPLLLGAFAAMIALAGLVRKQWIHNERLPYPIAQVTLAFIDDRTEGRRYAAIFRNKVFWIGLVIAGGVIIWNGLYAYNLVPVQITTNLQLIGSGRPFQGHPWTLTLDPWKLFNLKIYFSIIALCFFLSLELSFSLWFFFIAAQLGVMLMRISGIPVEGRDVGEVSTGGFFTMCILILWVGRQYYWRVIRAACFLRRDDPDAAQAAPYLWVLLVGCAAMVGFFVSRGAPVLQSVVAILMFLGFLLVLARIVAEAGVPLLQLPGAGGLWFNANLFAILGFSLPATALMPLTLIGVTLMADPRESLVPYAVNADYMGDRVGAPPKRLSGLIFAGAAIGCVVAFGSMIFFAYTSGGSANDTWATSLLNRDGFAIVSNGIGDQTNPNADTHANSRGESLINYGAGAATVAALGSARFFFAAWPFHPLGFLTMVSPPTGLIWFSFFLGWLLRAMVMRYGGSRLYTQLKPAAIGLIAGEALALGIFMLAKIIGHQFFDMTLDTYKVLPG